MFVNRERGKKKRKETSETTTGVEPMTSQVLSYGGPSSPLVSPWLFGDKVQTVW